MLIKCVEIEDQQGQKKTSADLIPDNIRKPRDMVAMATTAKRWYDLYPIHILLENEGAAHN